MDENQKSNFLAVVISTNGEMGAETIKMIEIFTRSYSNKIAKDGKRDDDYTIEQLTATFSNRVRDTLQIEVAKGLPV